MHGCNVLVVDQKMFEWNVNVLKFITLHGCNVFGVNPKISSNLDIWGKQLRSFFVSELLIFDEA